ncbi:thioredoxin domain-containing protein 11 [Phymastichus coffea]|uniref:thioredoxin domain-containing protein 11 n=1 Tax=Phymastichus coffea TaxID=108790 RepID=UPI00273BC677|nr:thioredoxin domain-containing protein 11 [Phymastichus coffea]
MSSEESCDQDKPVDTPRDAEESEQQSKPTQIQKRSNENTETKGNGKGRPNLKEKLMSKMFAYTRDIICFFLGVVSAFAVLHNAPPRISKPPVARPMFNESSLVLDFYKGHLSALVDRVTESDFSFVMYYAPWDAESQALTEEFESVARYYHNQVFFAAINCWHPGSECRARYGKIQNYPVLMVYPSKESGVQYKGIKSAPYMIRFLHDFMNPIKRVIHDYELLNILKSYDAVMIGYFQFTGLRISPGYNEFYRAALRTFEKEPNGEVAFVAITNPNTAKDHGIVDFPSGSLLMWNETMFYPNDRAWNAENIAGWISSVVHRVVTWLQPPGSKSSTLASYLWDGPVLFLFTPRNPLHFENENYNLLKEVALQYYDCSGNPQIQNLVSLLSQSRAEAALKAFEKREWCASILEEEKSRHSHPLHEFTLAGLNQPRQQRWSNAAAKCCSGTPTNKCVSCTRVRDNDNNDNRGSVDEQFAQVCAAPGMTACHGRDVFSMPLSLEHLAFVDKRRNSDADIQQDSCSAESCDMPGKQNDEMDPQSSVNVKKSYDREECRCFLAGYSYQRPIYPRDSESVELELTELICQVNKTLALVTIDSLQYFHFAEGLGIDITRNRDKTVAVIIDPADESQYVMEEIYGRNALVRFINNFTSGYLRRAMRSSSPRRFVRSFESKCKADDDSRICVPELSSDNFLKTVLNPHKDVVVMYHSPYCAFCSAVAYVYLTVAHYLSKMDHLEFVRIDGDNNDLPWEYTMNRYPSILFFPAKRKEDSTLFPTNLQITVGNLLSFILANCNEESHLEALINICAIGAGGSAESCLSRTRWFCLDILEALLRDFRKLRRFRADKESTKRLLDSRRRILLLRLKIVREAHLLLGTSSNLAKEKLKVRTLRKKFKRFYAKLANLEDERDKQYSMRYSNKEATAMELNS